MSALQSGHEVPILLVSLIAAQVQCTEKQVHRTYMCCLQGQ